MIRYLPQFALIVIVFALCSCSRKTYTHQQVMQRFKTQNEVLKKLGQPDQKIKTGLIEEWVYDRDTEQNGNAIVKKTVEPVLTIQDSLNSSPPPLPNRYVRFIFNEKGDVLGYKTEGVDMGESGHTGFFEATLEVIGAIVALSVIVFLELVNDGLLN
jgi:hypothetical protein